MGMGTLAGLTRLKRRAASARRSLALRLPPKLPVAGKDAEEESDSKGLAVEVCRSKEAVLQGWDDKVFPGEGKGFESVRGKTFTGKQSFM